MLQETYFPGKFKTTKEKYLGRKISLPIPLSDVSETLVQ
jgi:hypothetical protein